MKNFQPTQFAWGSALTATSFDTLFSARNLYSWRAIRSDRFDDTFYGHKEKLQKIGKYSNSRQGITLAMDIPSSMVGFTSQAHR